jgi:RNA polymerase sigma-70 factor (ECF subfamily)
MIYPGRVVADARTGPAAREIPEFDRRFESVRPRLLAICRGLLGADAAEDVVQDTYIRARERHDQLRDPASFEAWLARMAVNLCFNRHRARRALATLLPKLHRSAPSVQPDIALRELIEALPPRERTLIVLHNGHGYRLHEMAALLDLTPTNARTILFRARARLGKALREAER